MHPRFGVDQSRPGGKRKIRAIDNFSWGANVKPESKGKRAKKTAMKAQSANGHTTSHEKLAYDSLDTLIMVMRMIQACLGTAPCLMKADIDAAFRRIPVRARDRWAAWIAFMVAGQVLSVRLCIEAAMTAL